MGANKDGSGFPEDRRGRHAGECHMTLLAEEQDSP